ncbi:hypothetical protein D3870_20200 [Noviherbaspirillum cavernae]|uniref:Uncharacterized protein n=2 Tax=Noviherbaspirillum cavernae TaxID=2320862 RepID=A0A418WW27_9BURK|nr:hypothetical protein D3870_20200 [Noviherbaspirillum cavernae]
MAQPACFRNGLSALTQICQCRGHHAFCYQHGGFGKPHALGIITLVVLAVAVIAGATPLFGKASRYVEVIGFSLTFFFHFIPGVTETTTRLPPGDPLFANADVPELKIITGVLFLLFVVGAIQQYRRLKQSPVDDNRTSIDALVRTR